MFNEIGVDLNAVEEYVTSDKFAQFLLNTTTDFGTAAFVMQETLNAIQRAKASVERAGSEEKGYIVPQHRLVNLLAAEAELDYLNAAGVDNWEGYGALREDILESWGVSPDAEWEDIAMAELEEFEKVE